ncbi:MAG TPA: hypothetical protein VE172_01805 [Stackebrandtia sp.]|jgi:hypothetical protein|uniref:hypothetical protein n=1 Tax=Stackebrandtia sp. TaxID=2023065 RepID=UPI002D4CA1BC|nr:hypothetical protein [Stackebrandtia sp.]HZE37520.1 hypothetical protein [Stackebrandtia sp.]
MPDTLHDRIQRINVVATSPDGLVRARYGKGFVVEVDPRCASRHTDQTLAVQATKAVGGALKGYDLAIRKALHGSEKTPAPEETDHDDSPRANFLRATRLIAVEATSTGSDITAGWHPDGGLTIALRPRTLDRLGTSNLSNELSAAVSTLLSRIARARDKAYNACYRSLSRTEKPMSATQDQFVANLYELRNVARRNLPNIARAYAGITSQVHATAFWERTLFRPGDPVDAAWRGMRDRLETLLGQTTTRLADAAIALDLAVTDLAATDHRNARALMDARAAEEHLPAPLDPNVPGQIPTPPKPGDPVATKKLHVGPIMEVDVPEVAR